LEAALEYRFKYNWSVIPLSPGTKIPPKDFGVIQFRTRFATREEIEGWWKENPNYNVAVITGKLSDMFVVDLDKYKPNYSEETFLKYFGDNIQTPIEKTPRGGEHLLFSYPDEDNPSIHSDTLPAIDYRGEGGYIMLSPSSFEGKTGEWIIPPNGKPLARCPEPFLSLLKSNINNKYIIEGNNFVKNGKLKNVKDVKSCYIYSNEGSRNQDLYHAVHLLKYGSATPEEINIVLNILAKTCEPEYPEKEIPTIIESALKREARRKRNISREVREWSLLIEDEFLLKDCYNELNIVNSEDKLTTRVTLSSLCIDKLLEKGKARGSYRPISKGKLDKMQFIKGQIEEFPIMLPLDLSKMCRIYPKNIIVIAGSKSAGKTTMALTIAVANHCRIPVVYFNSEMGDEEYSERMKGFGFTDEDQINFEMYPLKANYQDYITGEKKIFIVDFLEIHDKFYEVAIPIRKIHDNLKDGICIVCVQMKSGADLGRGGEFSAEKARLYLTMEYLSALRQTKVTIYDAKSPKIDAGFPDGIRGMFRNIKIINGSRISSMDNWKR